MSEVMWGINFVTLNSIGEADRADKIEKIARWAIAHNATIEVADAGPGAGSIVKINRAQLSGAELETIKHLARQHKEYVPNCQLVSICNTLFYCGAACIVGFCKEDDTMPVPKCLMCGKACPNPKGRIVIGRHQCEWICLECWEAAFGKEEGEKYVDSY